MVDGLEAIRLRGLVAFGAHDINQPPPVGHPDLVADLVAACLDEHHALADRCAASALVGFRLGVATLLGQSDELLTASIKAAKTHGWAVHTHLAEVREELVWPAFAGDRPPSTGPPTPASSYSLRPA